MRDQWEHRPAGRWQDESVGNLTRNYNNSEEAKKGSNILVHDTHSTNAYNKRLHDQTLQLYHRGRQYRSSSQPVWSLARVFRGKAQCGTSPSYGTPDCAPNRMKRFGASSGLRPTSAPIPKFASYR